MYKKLTKINFTYMTNNKVYFSTLYKIMFLYFPCRFIYISRAYIMKSRKPASLKIKNPVKVISYYYWINVFLQIISYF